MKRIITLLGLALATLALACSGADNVTAPSAGCWFDDGDAVEKNGPCEPCEPLQSGPEGRNKNKPCIPEESTAAPGGRRTPPS